MFKYPNLLKKIAEMINQEHDEHADLVSKIQSRTDDKELLKKLLLVYQTRIKMLERIYELIKEMR